MTINAFTASDSILIPVQCEYYALEGLSQLLNTVRLVQKHFNPELEIEGVLLTMYDARTNLGAEVVEEVRRYFQEKFMRQLFHVMYAYQKPQVMVYLLLIMIHVQRVLKYIRH